MATINDILITRNLPGVETNQPSVVEKKSKSTINFSDTIKDFLEAVNKDQKEASKSVENVVLGKSDTLADAMTKLEEAGLSFQLMLEIKNKLIDAYNELNRMQV
ncbi:MAG: flagellar hook-basal body complex protein FliE [Candidatus Marinimicrobia bacterium]|nr:flagellar hook-basal body complex protein FliE [Candidatus Neomarinimicrobiota bacterium]